MLRGFLFHNDPSNYSLFRLRCPAQTDASVRDVRTRRLTELFGSKTSKNFFLLCGPILCRLPGTSLLGALSGGALSGIATAGKLRAGHASDSDSDNDPESNDPRGYPWFYMTDEVIDAATMCMVAQAEEAVGYCILFVHSEYCS